jgi:hypothetical protein
MRAAMRIDGVRPVWRWTLGLAIALVSVLASSAVASAGVAWRVDALANTTVAAGGQLTYLLQITNVGDTDASFFEGESLQVQLAPGVTVAPGGFTGWPFLGFGVCSPSDTLDGLNAFSCGLFAELPRRTGAPPNNPGNQQILLTVDVPSDVSGVLTSRFTVTDPNAPGPASTAANTTVTSASPQFGVATMDGQVASDPAGDALTQAGGHPYSASVSLDFNTETNPNPFIGPLWPIDPVKDVAVDLPAGFAGFPPAAATCTAPELIGPTTGVAPTPECPPASQVGTTLVRINGLGEANVFGPVPVYNMVAPPNVPAQFGFNVAGSVVTLRARVRPDANYALAIDAIDVPEGLPIASTTVTLWGVPADSSHDNERACAGQREPFELGSGGPTCSSGAPQVAFVRNPTSCDPPTPGADGLTTTAHVDSWIDPGAFDANGAPVAGDSRWKTASFVSHLPPAYPNPSSEWGAHQLPTGCDKVPFDPTLTAAPQGSARADTPTGFAFDLSLPQSDDPTAVGEGDLKKAVVTLPAGVRVSPSSAGGLGGCSPDQIGLGLNSDPACPDSSKIGTLSITTPLLEKPITDGSIYLATPHQNPFGSLIAIYLVAKGPGVVLKIPGEAEADPVTGQLTATFDNNPQLPFSNLHLEFKSGPRAPLVTPKQCGTYTTHAELTSWSGKTVSSDSSFTVNAGPNGGPCAPDGFSPSLHAGTANPIAGHDSAFNLRLTRSDEDQELASLAVNLPGGLLGRIANAVLCPGGAAAAGTCTDASKVGDVTVGAGAGTNPFYITTGRAYITGPYKGAPFGLSIVVPAVAGPFDLGNVVVRSALFIDRNTAAVTVASDPLPTILQGIPLDVRDVRVMIDRPHFIVNPTSCAPKRISSTVGSTQGAIAHPTVRFQAIECANLGLAPKLSMTVGARHHTQAGVSTPVSTTLRMPKGDTNLRSVSVTLPGTLNALLPVVNRACKLSEFRAGHCGNRAKVGTAVAVTPLLRDPLRGSVYFVKNPARILPDLMVALRGQVALDVTAKVHIPGGKRLATQFDTIPDAPITKFTLRIVSGKNGPVGIATNLCSAKGRSATASVGYRGQNGKIVQTSTRLRIVGCPRAVKRAR